METSEALDLSKENIQPLKQGRNATQLGAALQAQTNTEAQQQLTKEREKFELKIRMYEGDDPLQPRFEYVAWLEQSYPKHGPESNLIPLLEDTLTTFKDDERYKQDPRFVELLIKYFDTQPNPLELYQLVYSQGLGTMCALFYRAWADEFDKNNDMLRADQIYLLGIKNRAQPLEQLTEFHKQFQLSVGRRTLGYTDTYTEETDSYSREALSKLKNKKKVPSIRESNGAAGTWPLATSISHNQNQRVKAPVKVYQECSNNENFPNYGITEGGGGTFPTYNTMQKENCLKPGPWSGQNRRSKHTPKPPTTPTFQVHEDEGAIGGDQLQRPGAVVPRALKPRKQDTFTCPLAVFEPPDPTKKAMYCKHKVYVGGREFQFEELRAAEYMRRLEQQRLERELKPNVNVEFNETVGNLKNQKLEEEPLDVLLKTPEVRVEPEVDVEVPYEHIPTLERVELENILSNKAPVVNIEPLFNDEMPNELMVRPEDPEPVHLILPEKRVPVQKFVGKGLMDADASLTANTKEAMNLVQEMWGSPSPVQVPAQQRKTYGGFVPPPERNNGDVFKVPAVPRPKIPPFTLYTDEEPAVTPSLDLPTNSLNIADANKGLKFSVFTDNDGDLAQSNFPIVNNEEKNKKPSTFPVYSDDFEKEPCSSYGLPGDKTRNELAKIESNDSKKLAFQSKPLLGLIAEVIKPSEINSITRRESIYSNLNSECKGLVLENSSGLKCLYPSSLTKEISDLPSANNIASKCLVYNNDPANQMKDNNKSDKQFMLETPFVKAGEDSDEPLARLISEQTLTQQSQMENISLQGELAFPHRQFQQPQKNGFQLNVEDTDGDFTNETCNTKAFAFALPSSTPMNGHFQSSSSQPMNLSYTVEELPQKPVSVVTQAELSMILEASKERGNSSSSTGVGATQFSPESELNDVKQKLPKVSSAEIAEIEKSIGILNMTGDIDPFSPELTSQLLILIGFPKPNHLCGVHQFDRDLTTLSVNSTVKLGAIKYVLQEEIGKGAYARVIKATRDDKQVALKHQKPACVWELYIAQELQLRLKKMNSNMIGGFMEYTNAFIFRNASVFETEWAVHGSLLNVVNAVKKKTNKPMHLNLVIMISIQMISVIEHLHKCKIIHGDIKPDNFVLTAVPSLNSPQQICIKLIDFGRSIDMTLLPAGATFTTVVTTKGFTCTEMLANLPWTYQTDTFGLAGTLYLLLIGDYMKVLKRGKKWQLQQTIPRYYERNLWEPIFSSLLNVESCEKQANLSEFNKSLKTYLESVNQFSLEQQLNTFYNILNGW